MKSNQVSVLVVLLLCLVMGGFLYVVDRSSDDEMGWSPSELYSELGARSYEGSSFSDVTFSGGASSDGVAVSMRNGSFSLRTRTRHASSPSSPIALSPNSPIASSPNSLIGHMTSSAEFHSFGGGSNMAMGSYTSSSNSLLASSPAIGSYSPSPSSPIALSPNASGVGFNNLPSLQGGDGGRPVVSAEQALMSSSSSASGLFGGMMSSYGTASYGGVYGSSPSRVNNRFNAPPGMGEDNGFGNLWLDWLNQHYNSEDGTMPWGTFKDGVWQFSWQDAWNAYESWATEFAKNNPGAVVPLFEEWLRWFKVGTTYEGASGQFFTYVPIGNVLPLLLMAIIYMIILLVRRNKTAQL